MAFDDITMENNEFAITFTYIGEGYNGDYNEDDKEDEPLLRFDIVNKLNGDTESRCTMLSAESSMDKIRRALEIIFSRVTHEYNGDNLSHLADELSWIGCSH